MTRVLITGAAGFTGRYLASTLADEGYEVHGTVYGDPEVTVAGASELHEMDLGDSENVSCVVRRVAPDKVVHLAAISFVAHSDVSAMYRANVLGTRNLLFALASNPTPPVATLLVSSANVYGNARSGMLDESVQPSPANDYGITKAAAEIVARAYQDRLPLIIVRPFNYTGRGQSSDFLIPKLVSHVRRRCTEIELGNLDVARDFSDVRIVVEAYARLLNSESALGGTFNVCSGSATSLRDLIEMAQQISGHRLNVRVNPAFVRENEVRSLWGSPQKLEKVIGPLQMPPIREIFRWMIQD